MSYLVLARKYRPQKFEDVVEQQQVTQTLTNAITAGRVAHAVLFTGPRGTGKTTIARILAKAMNCEQGPTSVPCNECRSCREITSGHAADVFEIDGASNNSVNEIRELRSNIKFLPAHSPYKIYIIDEVHMLSLAAFNALLKTLEEPPAHVMFLFATTEPHKIPATILSRCQRHDLAYIRLEAVVAHLAKICEQENIPVETKSLELIAREAGGSIRDALSLLDQVMSCSETGLPHERIVDILGIIDTDMLFGLSEAVLNRDIKQSLGILEKIYLQGYDIKKFYAEILEHFRNLLVYKLGEEAADLRTLPAAEIERIKEQTTEISALFLHQILTLLLAEEEAIRFSSRPRIAAEMVFIKLLYTQPALPLDHLIEKIEALKNQFLSWEHNEPLPDAATAKKPEAVSTSSPDPEAGKIQESSRPYEINTKEKSNSSSLPTESLAIDAAENSANSASIDQTAPEVSLPRDQAAVWEEILSIVDERNPKLAASLINSTLSKMNQQTLEIDIYGSRINLEILTRPKSMAELQQICAEVLNVPRIDITINNQQTADPKTNPEEVRAEAEPAASPVSPLVSAALEIFDGEIVSNS